MAASGSANRPVGLAVHGGRHAISRSEFVAIVASLMAVEALAIDIMLPALPNIGDTYSITNPNDRSLVLTLFLVRIRSPLLAFGPRRTVRSSPADFDRPRRLCRRCI